MRTAENYATGPYQPSPNMRTPLSTIQELSDRALSAEFKPARTPELHARAVRPGPPCLLAAHAPSHGLPRAPPQPPSRFLSSALSLPAALPSDVRSLLWGVA
eukprot:3817958-Prymnesium_polylepis.1